MGQQWVDLVDTLQNFVNAVSNAPQTPQTFKAIAEPGNWNGDQSTFQNWWSRMMVWIECQSATLSKKQLTVALLLWMEGKAADFTRVTIDRYSLLATMDLDTWPAKDILKDLVEKHFWIDVVKEESYKRLVNLKQGNMLIKVFTQNFELLWADAGLDTGPALQLYKESIEYNIYSQLMLKEIALTDTLKAWQDAAVVTSKMFNQMRLGPQFTEMGTQPGRGAPMDTCAVQSTTEMHKCYNCNQVGHLSNACTQPCCPRQEQPVFDPLTGKTTFHPAPQTNNRAITKTTPASHNCAHMLAQLSSSQPSQDSRSVPTWQTNKVKAFYYDMFIAQAWQMAADGLKGKGKAE